MKALFRDQLTALLAVVIFPGVGQEAFIFAIVIIAVPFKSIPCLIYCNTWEFRENRLQR